MKIVKLQYLSEKLSDFDEVCTLHQILNPVTVTSPKIEIFGVQGFQGHHSLTLNISQTATDTAIVNIEGE